MRTITVSKNYSLKWQINFAPHYKFTDCKKLINCKTGRIIKKTVNGSSIGYWINIEFWSLNNLRKHIVKIEKINCPF